MNYRITFVNGDILLIDESQFKEILENKLSFFEINGTFYNHSAILKIQEFMIRKKVV